ncbi:hypothetical protein [Gordonia paraffinivorans]|uniref:hypothetical protein n=1 Tax=Gordonia paraffinivorans TaxID=175628 RepID=UPI0014475953|nr:hypothetical protein [Gordonia paraffinivorans]
MTTTKIRLAAAGASLAIAAGALAAAGATQATASSVAPSCNAHQQHVTSVVTANSAATICRWGDGDLEYRGLARSTGDTIRLPVSEVHEQENGSGRLFYVAHNNGYRYLLFDGLGLSIVGPDGLLISSEDAI